MINNVNKIVQDSKLLLVRVWTCNLLFVLVTAETVCVWESKSNASTVLMRKQLGLYLSVLDIWTKYKECWFSYGAVCAFLLYLTVYERIKKSCMCQCLSKPLHDFLIHKECCILLLVTSRLQETTKYLLIKWMTWIFLACNMLLWINYWIPMWLLSAYVQSFLSVLLNTYESTAVLFRAQSSAVVKVTSVQHNTIYNSIINCHLLVSNHCYKITSNMMKMDLHTCYTQCKL